MSKNKALITVTKATTPTTKSASCHHLYRRRTPPQRELNRRVRRWASTAMNLHQKCTHSNLVSTECKNLASLSWALRLHRLRPGVGVLPGKLSRYTAVATLLLKHRPDLLAASELSAAQPKAPSDKAEAEGLAKDLEKLGPT